MIKSKVCYLHYKTYRLVFNLCFGISNGKYCLMETWLAILFWYRCKARNNRAIAYLPDNRV